MGRAWASWLWAAVIWGSPGLLWAQGPVQVRLWYQEHKASLTAQALHAAGPKGWSPVEGPRFHPSRKGTGYWLKLELRFAPSPTKTPARWAVTLSHVDVEAVKVFLPPEFTGHKSWRQESLKPYETHTLTRRLFYPLVLPKPRSRVRLYVFFRTYKALAWRGLVGASVEPLSRWLKADQSKALYQGLYFGILLSLVVLHLFWFLWLGDRAALWFALYNGMLALYIAMGTGLMPSSLWGFTASPMERFRMLEFVLGLYVFGAIHYTRVFLDSAVHTPALDRWMQGYLALVLFYLFATPWASALTVGLLSQALGLLSPLVTIVPGWVYWRRGFPPALIYLLAWGLFSVAAFVFASPLWDRWGFLIFQVGSAISALMLSLAMVQRIRLLREEQAQAQEQLQRSEQMATLGQLVAGVAHEINNPNNFLIFNLPILRQYIDGMASHVQSVKASDPGLSILGMPVDEFLQDTHELIDTLEHGAQRIDGIVRDLREYVGGHGASQRQVGPLAPTLERALALVGKEVRQRASLDVEIAEDLPLVAQHSGKLEQVLINVLLNAAQAVEPPEGAIALVARRAAAPGGGVEILVEDNGPGIPEALERQIFDPFFTTKGRDGSMGLGLSISLRIIEEHQGSITVGRGKEGGTLVTLALPAADAPQPRRIHELEICGARRRR